MNIMDFEEWVEQYKPIKNHFNASSSVDGYLFMHYGKEWDFVKNFTPSRIWSLIITDLDDGSTSWDILDGVSIVNREGYLVTEEAYHDKSLLTITY